MRGNTLVWLAVGVMGVMAIVTVINKMNEPEAVTPVPLASESNSAKKQAVLPDQKALPKTVDGDTNTETLKQVLVKLDTIEERYSNVEKRMGTLTSDVEAIHRATGTAKGDDKFEVVKQLIDKANNDIASITSQFTDQRELFNTTESNGYTFTNDDLGWGVGGSNKAGGAKRSADKGSYSQQPRLLSGYVAITPYSETATPSVAGLVEPDASGVIALAESSGLSKEPIKTQPEAKRAEVSPRYTIPASSTLIDNVTMTALIGRVPVGDKLKDPFPVKLIVGDNNLATNGHRIPGLKGIVFEGIATGDWNLGCVAVSLTRATYTFMDGRIQHMTGQGSSRDQMSSMQPIGSQTGIQGSIGYISNKQGVPCISGERITDAHKQLATTGLLGLAENFYQAKALAETDESFNDRGNRTSAVTGDKKLFAKNKTAAGALGDVKSFYQARMRDTFDAVVSPAGIPVDIHITTDLYVDYDPNARQIFYAQSVGGNNATRLD